MGIRMRAKISIAFLSISLIASFGLSSNQAFAGTFGDSTVIILPPVTCEDCDLGFEICEGDTIPFEECEAIRDSCRRALMCNAVGGEFIGLETTSVLAAGAQYTAAWMIPVIVSAIGIGIVIARKF